MERYNQYTEQELLDLWDIDGSDALFNYLTTIRSPPLFPAFSSVRRGPSKRKLEQNQKGGADEEELEGQEFSDYIENAYGLYPSIDDPRFHEKLFRKLEFSENKQESLRKLQEKGIDLCKPDNEFELSPVQRFVSRFLSAQSPYNSALLYHGVGVGKTCAAISIAESFLNIFPTNKVIIVAPPNIQPNFKRTIFDIDNVVFDEDENVPNTLRGCTGNFYLKRTGTEYEREKGVIASRVRAAIDSRYEFMGYIQFGRYIDTIRRRVPEDRMSGELRREFEGRLVIIDEAHNLRDAPGETEDDNIDSAGGDEEIADSGAGKRLTPSLIEVLKAVRGMKLVLLTATPMYNNYREIIFLLNLLLRNDKRILLKESDIFDRNGDFTARGREILGHAASAYVSFMRGENPLSFPIRLRPNYESGDIPKIEDWPTFAPNGADIPDEQKEHILRLPFVPVSFEDESLDAYLQISSDAVKKGGMAVASIDTMVQTGNWLFPADEDVPSDARKGDTGFDSCFSETSFGTSVQFTSRLGLDWLSSEEIGSSSPKTKFILDNIKSSQGVIFVYSRFIKSGALPFVLALEANGYTPTGRDTGLLRDTDKLPEGRQCAFCDKRERSHKGAKHLFTPAKYILLTGKASLSPNNTAMVERARGSANKLGRDVKVVVGSQVASEGIDLRFIREIYVFDSWFHLNKMEQVLGRGVRTCSHSLLEPQFRNTTIYLLVNTFPDEDRETADLYMYRVAMSKAQQVGRVTRVLKEYALDCNLNIDAIIIPSDKKDENSLDDQEHVDAHGVSQTVSISDAPYTAICDWIEGCDYKCLPEGRMTKVGEIDSSTYDEYSARWHESALKSKIREIFEENEQPVFLFENIQKEFKDLPELALKSLLAGIVGNQSFHLTVGGQKGYIVFRNGLYLFQPDSLIDTKIPLALRIQSFPVKRDEYEPPSISVKRSEVVGKSIWEGVLKWAERIRAGEVLVDLPVEVDEGLRDRYTNPAELVKEQQHLYGVLRLYGYMKGNEEWRSVLAEAMLGLVWDEMMTIKEQMAVIKTEEGRRVGKEQYMAKGSREVFRFVDTQTGHLKYMCGLGGEIVACDVAVARVFDSDGEDPLNKLQANTNTVGGIYGFLVPNLKTGFLIFKTTDKASPPGKAPPKGGACEIVTQISYHLESLVEIGNYLANAGYPERFGLSMANFTGNNKFQNASRACSLKNIILRWMELKGLGGRHWFFRSIAAYKSNHQVLADKPKKSRAKKIVAAAAI